MRDSVPHGEGERREAARRRKRWLIVAGLAIVGIVPGFYMGYQDGSAMAQSRPSLWPPAVAAALAAVYLLAVIGGGVLMNTVMDELERQRGYKAVSFAGTALMVVYPTWFLLWRGGLVPEPVHWILFILFWLNLALATLWYRFR
jgi:hypothetical protein